MKRIRKHNYQNSEKYLIIWDTVRQIPKGKVSTYGHIAIVSGVMGQARRVGYALNNLPARSKIPWHRVVNSQGKISLPRAGGHYRKQKLLLQKEGVVFKDEKIDLDQFGWLPWLNNRPKSSTRR
jgi:methylated-DNA-protein-cysteine methyltransferase related protein